MRFPFVVAFITSVAVAGTFWYQSTAHICPVPLTYRLGQLDSHFPISREEAIQRLQEAERAWEEKTGRELFKYSEEGTLVVDFVYDDRQAEADSEGAKRQVLDQTFAETESLKQRLEELQKDYDEKAKTYEVSVASYEADLAQHNERVGSYNDQGGAPTVVFEELERERKVLDARSRELNADADNLNKLAETINTLGQKSNALVEAYNKEVEAYNSQYGFAKEFTQGDYQNGKIHIYTFSSKEELVSVLVHEFGHALGLDHVDDSSAVMYYLLKEDGSVPVLTSSDITAFTEVCGEGDERLTEVRRLIREFIQIINK